MQPQQTILSQSDEASNSFQSDMKDLYYAVELKKVSRGLEMYFYTSSQTLCYNFGQDHEREQSFKLDLILSGTQIHSTR